MKTIEIHPLSAALGATFVGLILITLGFSPVVTSCSSSSSSSSGGTTTTTGFGGGEEPYDVTVLNDLTIESMPSVDIATIPAVDIASMPALDLSSLTSIRVKGIPTHEDFVVIEQDAPYTVPVGRTLVLTGMATVSAADWFPNILFDGVRVFYAFNEAETGGSTVFPLGFSANSGVVVEASDIGTPNDRFRVFGYLEDA